MPWYQPQYPYPDIHTDKTFFRLREIKKSIILNINFHQKVTARADKHKVSRLQAEENLNRSSVHAAENGNLSEVPAVENVTYSVVFKAGKQNHSAAALILQKQDGKTKEQLVPAEEKQEQDG